jgi:alkylation response protein AidB-like acyl-CoA dehydrogenase
VAGTTRLAADLLKTLAGGDASVALVAAMHPAVLSFWLASPEAPAEYHAAWDTQQVWISEQVLDGAWWGTITSEPGSGGDVTKTKSIAQPDAAHPPDRAGSHYRLSGDKHFGSGSGVTSFMLTSARPEDETTPDWFFLDVRGASWDGSTGMTLTAPWDGHGMSATQSHGMRFDRFPAIRFAWPGSLAVLQGNAGPFVTVLFTAVIAGIVETAVALARVQLTSRRESLRPYEQVEWTRAEVEAWLIAQAYEGMLRAVERSASSETDRAATQREVLQAKTATAELAETVLTRLCRVMGGGSYGRSSPFGFWFEDVRALGFLRPPWGLAYDRLASL